MPRSFARLALVACLLVSPARAEAQRPGPARADSATRAALELPDAVADAVVNFLNDPRRLHYRGAARVAAGETIRRDVAALDGTLEVEGRVEGSVVVANGDLLLRPGAVVTGDLLVVGGVVAGLDSARVGGEIVSFSRPLELRREGERVVRVRSRAERAESAVHSDFLVSTGRSYNRVEGLPITFGPRIETAGPNPLRLHALATYRTEAGLTLDTDRMGYYLRAEKMLGGRRELRAGLSAYSMIEPIEEWHLSDLENALATFVFHQDYRDHYERQGASALAHWEPRGAPLSLAAEVRWEHHDWVGVGSPWTLLGGGDAWRPQPLVAVGRLGSAALQATFDTRSYETDPSTGWHVRGRLERGFHADLRVPDSGDGGAGSAPLPGQGYGAFTTGLLDVRRYNRIDPETRVNFRFLVGGSVDGSHLPPQRQHALGGEGSLPGYGLFQLDCGARDQLAFVAPAGAGGSAFPRYGCDSFALLQAELRGKLSFRLRIDSAPWDDDQGWGLGWDVAPDWTLFADAGRGWALDGRPDEPLRADVGAGLLVDRLGIFVAAPLSGPGGLNLFLRLGPRF